MHTIHVSMFLWLAAASAAQSGSPLMAIGQGFSVDAATAVPGLTPKSVGQVECDFDSAPPVPPSVPSGMPDFSALPIPAGLDVDALSLGVDWVLADSAGFVAIPPNHWGAITFSVRRTTAGAAGSLIAGEVAAPGGAAADVFAYVLDGSVLPSPPTGVPFRALDSKEINVDAPGTPANIDAHDAFIGLLYLENPQLAATLPPPTVFFSVTAATAAAIPPAWAAPALRSGATVFSTSWSPMTSSWSAPVVALTPAILGLDPTEDLDALALDLVHARVLLSTDLALPPPLPTPPRDALLYSNLGSGSNTPYRLPGGIPVSTKLGLGPAPDDIDGICALDPGDQAQPSQIRLERMLGTAGPPAFPGFPTLLQASVYRRFATGQERFVTFMTGWPPPGVPAPGIAIVGWSATGSAGPWNTGGIFIRPNPASPYANFDGHPERWEVVIPPVFSMTGIPITFLWGALSATTMDLSLPVTVVL